MTLGTMMYVNSAVNNLFVPVVTLTQLAVQVSALLVVLQRISYTLDSPQEVAEDPAGADFPMPVRSGIRAILFTQVNEEQALAMDAYLKAMRPVPSPYLVKGELSEKALEGKDLFEDSEVGCIQCHFGTYFTDQSLHNVGTAVADDAPHTEWDTPTLIECWRTAPYLHDGTAITIMDVLTTRNKDQKHGHTGQLTREQLEALAEYVLSL